MSMTPLPVHMSCFGISSDAVNMVRGYSKPSYSERLATVRNSIAAATPDTSSAVSANNSSGPSASGNRVPAVGQTLSSRQAPQVKLRPLPVDQAQQAFGGSGPCSPPAAALNPNSSIYRATTKHINTVTPTLQALDFISIAVNSVGGGGVPRPYGKFQACRAGDGNATWERLPPPPGSWQARALPIAVTLLGESPPPHKAPSATSPPPRSQRSGSAGGGADSGISGGSGASPPPTRPLHGSAPAAGGPATGLLGARHSPAKDHHQARMTLTPPEFHGKLPRNHGHIRSRTHPGPGGQLSYNWRGHMRDAGKPGAAGPGAIPGVGTGAIEQSYYRRPMSSLHRSLVPLPPPEPQNISAWFALPAATFLADVPDVPEQLRMDNGYSVSRDFLKSGLNQPRRLPPPSPPRSPTQQSLSQQRQSDPLLQSFPHYDSLRQSGAQLPEPGPEDSLAIWNSLEAGAAAVAAGTPSSTPYGPPGATTKLRGVYVPLEKRVAEPPPAPMLSAPPGDAWMQLPWTGQVGPTPRGALHLPPETSLPRRNEAAGW